MFNMVDLLCEVLRSCKVKYTPSLDSYTNVRRLFAPPGDQTQAACTVGGYFSHQTKGDIPRLMLLVFESFHLVCSNDEWPLIL